MAGGNVVSYFELLGKYWCTWKRGRGRRVRELVKLGKRHPADENVAN